MPSGPVHLVWQDAVVFLGVAVLGYYYGFAWYPIVASMFVPYCLLQGAAMYANRSRGAAYIVFLGIPFLWYFYEHEVLRWFVPPILYLIPHFELPRNLGAMVERSAKSTEESPLKTIMIVRETYERLNSSGVWSGNRVASSVETLADRFWPYNRLSPQPTIGISRVDAVWFPIALTWWTASALSLIPENPGLRPENTNAPWAFCLLVGLYISIFRLGKYITGYSSPISILGRIATGRWLVPAYDTVFMMPIVSVGIALLTTTVLVFFKVPLAFLYTVPSGVAFLALMNFGTSLNTWRLTGAHRLVHGMRSRTGAGYEL